MFHECIKISNLAEFEDIGSGFTFYKRQIGRDRSVESLDSLLALIGCYVDLETKSLKVTSLVHY